MLNLSITKHFQTPCNCIAMKLIYVVGDMALHIIFVRTIIFFNSQTKSTNVEKEMKNILFLFNTMLGSLGLQSTSYSDLADAESILNGNSTKDIPRNMLLYDSYTAWKHVQCSQKNVLIRVFLVIGKISCSIEILMTRLRIASGSRFFRLSQRN